LIGIPDVLDGSVWCGYHPHGSMRREMCCWIRALG
jgi:hypothetical protein